MALAKKSIQIMIYIIYFSKKTYHVGTHQKRLIEAFLVSIHNNIISSRNKKNVNFRASEACVAVDFSCPWTSNKIW